MFTDLKPQRVWLPWKAVPKEDGKISKVPYNTRGVKCNDRSQDVTYDELAAFLSKTNGDYSGAGIHIPPGCVCIDLDNCVSYNEKNEGAIAPWALDILKKLEYPLSELSPSKSGVHIWVKAAKPGKACRRDSVEIYSGDDKLRFMTLTGWHIEGTATTIEERDISVIYEGMVSGTLTKPESAIEKPSVSNSPVATSSVQIETTGATITNKYALFMNGTATGDKPTTITDEAGNSITYADRSAADLAFATVAAMKHGNNPDAIWADYLDSCIFREEWGAREADFRRLTIANGIRSAAKLKSTAPALVQNQDKTEGNVAPKSFVMVAGDSFMLEKIPPRKVLMRTTTKGAAVFYAKSINQIFAWRGLGKTCVGLGLTAAFATGGSFLNFEAPEPVNVLYIEGELPAEQMQERWKQIIGKTNGRARLVTIDKQPEHSFPSFATAEGMARVEATLAQCAVEGFPVDVLFLDSVSTLFNIAANDEENWILIQSWLLRLRSQGFCIFFFHHAGKSGMSRSHSKSEDMLDVSIKLDNPNDREEGILHAIMEFDKARHGISEPASEIKMRPVHTENCDCKHSSGKLIGCRGDSVAWEHEAASVSKRARAFEMFAAAASVREVAKELKLSKSVVGRWSQEYGRGVINASKVEEVDI
ncbi:MAG: AAA family ATPase [Candidatus Acidiferrales bacterium]